MLSDKYVRALIRAEKKSKSQQNAEDYRRFKKHIRASSRITIPLTNLKNIKTAIEMLGLLTEELGSIVNEKDRSVFEKVFVAGMCVTTCSQHLKQAADPPNHGIHFRGTR